MRMKRCQKNKFPNGWEIRVHLKREDYPSASLNETITSPDLTITGELQMPHYSQSIHMRHQTVKKKCIQAPSVESKVD
jgi:hypothetical protein